MLDFRKKFSWYNLIYLLVKVHSYIVSNKRFDVKTPFIHHRLRRKWFSGKEFIKNRCPSGFQTTIEKKFKLSGGTYIEVPQNYRASQYDHTADDYIKKELSDRLYKLRDGTLVQRDWYSSYLLYCYDYRTQDIDKTKCNTEFDICYAKEKALITWIKANKIKVLNSGIKVA